MQPGFPRYSVSSVENISGTATPSSVQQEKKQSRLSRFLDEFKPMENPHTPYVTTARPKKDSTASAQSSQKELTTGQKVLKGYRKFQDIVVGPAYKVYL